MTPTPKKIFEVKKLLKTLINAKQNIVIIDGFSIRKNEKYAFFLEQGLKCRCCKRHVEYVTVSRVKKTGYYHLSFHLADDTILTIDHIVPKSIGGENDSSNFQALCEICNRKKGERIIKYD